MKYIYAFIACTLIAFAAHAQQCTTLVYQGAPVTVTGSGIMLNQIVPLVGAVTIRGGLYPNMVNQAPSWVDYFDFSPSFGPLAGDPNAQANLAVPYATFLFTTDSAGTIIGWNIQMGDNPDAVDRYSASSTQTGDTINFINGDSLPTQGTGTSTKPGTWTCLTDLIAQAATVPTIQAKVTTLQSQLAASQAQVASLQQQVAALHSWQNYWQWQGVGWKARADTLAQQLANANREIAILLRKK